MKVNENKRVKTCYSLPQQLIEKLNLKSKEINLNKSIIIQLALEEYLRKEQKGIEV